MRKLCEEFKHFRGQPIEIIAHGMQICGIVVESDEDGVALVDHFGRITRIENKHIEAVIQPQMRLRHLCKRSNCECCEREKDDPPHPCEAEEEEDC